MAALAVASAVGLAVDHRVLVGAPIWLKPLKFAVSFALYGLTLAWMLGRRPARSRTGWWAGMVVVVAGTVEMAVIVGQTVRGRRSHFNSATPLDTALFQIMGATIVVLWLATLVIAGLQFRGGRDADRAATWAIRLGALIALAGLALGGLMIVPTPDQQAAAAQGIRDAIGAHSVGVPDGGPAMPLTGWSTTGGDLRIPHFVGMHALQLLPLFLFGLDALGGRIARLRAERVRLRLVLVAAGFLTGLLALVTWQALRGQPLVRPDAATLGALTGLLAVTAAGAYAALSPSRRHDFAAPSATTSATAQEATA
ncbi:hypothetical protein [Streptomyces purpurogeneiscleroticus]|uniref:hypothetical protein n=1 Tax=Streptomyces purpurogeneiscleroticus TaxID=68259 RepID=UPI001CC0EFC3|nr:hypothetical protein [Streptomyces purpurogeneiscleroticus]MBZ4016436.1 hypothetical protein [Streptomyces purpurogeneiscleroticus]